MKNNSVIKPIILILTAFLFLAFSFDISTGSVRSASFIFLIICTIIVLAAFRKELPSTAVFYAMLTGMFLKLAYVIYTPVWCRQHDVIDFGAGEGHAAYMEYILSHKALPDFDPRTLWAFFQPPLHHMICAVWMWINIRLGLSQEHMHKNVQLLPFLYMCILTFTIYLICRELAMKKSATFVTMLIVSFHPIYILMSGSINNDALSVMLTVAALYFAIRWYMDPTTGRIMLLALSIGLAMSAKLSAALVAVPVGIMMIYKILTDTKRLSDRRKVLSYLLELIPFAVTVFPLGLWWTVRNKILFDMPANYIPEVGEHTERFGIVPTILDIRTASPFLYMKANGFAYDEYNLLLATVKSALFGEGDFAHVSPYLTFAGWILLASAAVITVLGIVAAVMICTDREAGPDSGIKLLLVLCAVTFAAGYTAFAISGRNLSAMNFRYSAAGVSVFALLIGLWHARADALGKKTVCKITVACTLIFAAASAAFYVLVGLFGA
ncbi:MAG: glycosyltransferase family 39 protein [Lachnospiraceae bacterium]|nr:glycosyltransferase family 39 protein [Lachnospiraceae bacterium]